MSDDKKGCPFCKSKDWRSREDGGLHSVKCYNCKAEGPVMPTEEYAEHIWERKNINDP